MNADAALELLTTLLRRIAPEVDPSSCAPRSPSTNSVTSIRWIS